MEGSLQQQVATNWSLPSLIHSSQALTEHLGGLSSKSLTGSDDHPLRPLCISRESVHVET